jgi:asparagine synthase (glutamine-hydrolysing)
MCGICGKLDPDGVNKDEIQRMLATLIHRGPDGEGIYVKHEIGLGHRRLSIIDLSGGSQPMSNEDGTLWVTFNGEIYNFLELRKILEPRHTFKTRSDTEVILHLYEDKQEECLKYLRGMFAFAIYDQNCKKLFLARDHLGQKPLYYHHDGNALAFSSEIKALLALKPELRELDLEALYEYLTVRIITPPRSMFRRIKKLPPGHYLLFQNGKSLIKRYWELNFKPKMEGDLDFVVSELDRQVQATVECHLVSDVPVGAFLSGGLDSSLIVAMISKFVDKPIETFSGDVPYGDYTEIPFARLVSKKYNTLHQELTIRPSLMRTLPDFVWHLDEPSDPLSVCMYYLAELVSKHVKVVLGGDGGDELFGGYDRYYGNVLVSYYALIPEFLRRHLLSRIIDAIPDGSWYRSKSHQLRWMHQMSFSQGGDRYAKSLSYFYFSDSYKENLYTEFFRNNVGAFDPEVCLKKYFDSDNAEDVIDKMLYTDSMTRMPDHPNMILDRMTMAHGLEARAPFLDHQLAQFCAGIPSKFKIKGTRTRYIEIELAKKYLPSEIVKKEKQGFSSPLTYLLADEFKLLYNIFLNDSHLVRDNYLQQAAISNLLEEHIVGKRDHGNRLWLLCNAEVWYRMYIEDQSRDEIRKLLNP